MVRLYSSEAEHQTVKTAFAQASSHGACVLAFPEAIGAIYALQRRSIITRKERRVAVENLIVRTEFLLGLPLSPLVVERAYALMEIHPLKGADAVHLAAAEKMHVFRPVRFCTVDKQLYKIAKKYVPVVDIPVFNQ